MVSVTLPYVHEDIFQETKDEKQAYQARSRNGRILDDVVSDTWTKEAIYIGYRCKFSCCAWKQSSGIAMQIRFITCVCYDI